MAARIWWRNRVSIFAAWRNLWLIFSQACAVGLGLALVLAVLRPGWLQPPAFSLRAAAAAARPAVVAITTQHQAAADPDDAAQPGRPLEGLGSGVIVDRRGDVLTNDHLVDGADDIVIKLADGRQAQAQVIGRDPDTDLALLRIDLPDLPQIVWGDDAKLRVGDLVLAIGYPFGVGLSVTQGIVGALGRSELGINTYENFIQTDAAINPGNSGGALVDTDGRLLGINSAIFSESGGSLGIGFAIPASSARAVLQQLLASGRVLRGWIGIEPRALTRKQAAALGLGPDLGVLVAGVQHGGPAERAGIRAGDVVLAVDGQAVQGKAQLMAAVAALAPGSSVRLELLRQGRRQQLAVAVAPRP